MRFDWKAFCEDHAINYITEGANVGSGNINIKCPLCGSGDPSAHMGLHLESGQWGCWRDDNHRGRKPQSLIRWLLRCSKERAQELAKQYGHADISELARVRERLAGPIQRLQPPGAVELPSNFTELSMTKKTDAKFRMYLRWRGFTNRDCRLLTEGCLMRVCSAGYWGWRIIFPVTLGGSYIGWVGRSVVDRVRPKYRGHPGGDALGHSVWNEYMARKAIELDGRIGTLVICEGPFDAAKVACATQAGVVPVAVMGRIATRQQVNLMNSLASCSERVVVMFDRDASGAALSLTRNLCHSKLFYATLPSPYKDPADMPPEAITELIFNPMIQGG